MIDWARMTREDTLKIMEIMDRAEELANEVGATTPDRMTLSMDLTAAHLHGPLDLEQLLAFPEGDFLHDVYGIERHIDRTTGDLGTFLPRCAKAVRT